jgi:hypothetical protein
MGRANQARVRFGLASVYPDGEVFFLLYISTIYRKKNSLAQAYTYIYIWAGPFFAGGDVRRGEWVELTNTGLLRRAKLC